MAGGIELPHMDTSTGKAMVECDMQQHRQTVIHDE